MTTGSLLAAPVFRAVDDNGAPLAGALLQFYETGTTTPTAVYTSASLATPLSNPVVADSGGLFGPIYLDPTVTYRCQLLTSASVLIQDIDPIGAGVIAATQTQVNAGVATGVYVDPATLAGWTGVAAALGYTPLNKAGDTATNLLIANTAQAVNSPGYLGAPVNEQDANYTLALADNGKLIRANSASGIAYTVPNITAVAFPIGNSAVVFRNAGAGVVTLTPAAGVEFLMAGSGTPSATIALAQWGLCTALMETSNTWVFSGVGMTG